MEEIREGSCSNDGGEAPCIRIPTRVSEQSSNHNSEIEEEEVAKKTKKRSKVFSDSDSELEKPKTPAIPIVKHTYSDWSSDEEKDEAVNDFTGKTRKTRIKSVSSTDDSDSETAKEVSVACPGKPKQSRCLDNKSVNLQNRLQCLQKSHQNNMQSLHLKVPQGGSAASTTTTQSHDGCVASNSYENPNKDTKVLDIPPQCVSTEYVRSDFDDSSSANETDDTASIEKIKQVNDY